MILRKLSSWLTPGRSALIGILLFWPATVLLGVALIQGSATAVRAAWAVWIALLVFVGATGWMHIGAQYDADSDPADSDPAGQVDAEPVDQLDAARAEPVDPASAADAITAELARIEADAHDRYARYYR